jgi:hypothetical protein
MRSSAVGQPSLQGEFEVARVAACQQGGLLATVHRFGFELRQQNIGAIEFASVAFGEVKADRIAERIDGGVNFVLSPPLKMP